jgi:plastocyanin
MKTFFPTKHRTLLIGGIINLLVLCILVMTMIGPSQGTQAHMADKWDYNSTDDSLPPCATATSISGNGCLTPSNQPPSCPINPQNFQYSDTWPTVGPMLLTTMSQELQDQNGRTIGVYDIYGRLVLEDHCSVATLMQKLKLDGQPIQSNQTYLLEEDALIQAAIANVSSTPLLLALVWVITQNNSQQLDSWFSAAILTDPINVSTQPTSTAQPTPTAPPALYPIPTFSPLSGVSVPSSMQQLPQQVSIVGNNGQYVFEPPVLLVPKGATVKWMNNSGVVQTIVSDTNAFPASSNCGPGKAVQIVFPTPGYFPYHSGTNPSVKGLVIVTSS